MKLLIRYLKEEDLQKGFFDTLSNLSSVGKINDDPILARKTFNKIINDEKYNIIVAEDIDNNQIVGSATLLIEQKFIHGGSNAGHIEDVATRKGFERKGIGKKIIEKLIEIAKEKQCYKIILDCDEKVSSFYEKLGFEKKSIMMRMDL